MSIPLTLSTEILTSESDPLTLSTEILTTESINTLPDTHVRLGSITGSGKKRRQKEVDILIAVDMMNHAIRQNMNQAILLTGDRDFTPLVETLIDFGLTVTVSGDVKHTSDILTAAADRYRPLTLSSYSSWLSDESQRTAKPLFSLTSGDINRNGATPVATGALGDWKGELYLSSEDKLLYAMKRPGVAAYINASATDLPRLKLYLSLEYGDASWLPEAI